MIGCLPTQALAFLAVFVYATHATQAIVTYENVILLHGSTESMMVMMIMMMMITE